MNELVPMVHPDSIAVDGWDISSVNLGDAMRRAKVLDVNLQDQLYSDLSKLKPRPSIYDADFIAANQVNFWKFTFNVQSASCDFNKSI